MNRMVPDQQLELAPVGSEWVRDDDGVDTVSGGWWDLNQPDGPAWTVSYFTTWPSTRRRGYGSALAERFVRSHGRVRRQVQAGG